MTSVRLVGDQALVRAGFRMILGAQEAIEIAYEAENGLPSAVLTTFMTRRSSTTR